MTITIREKTLEEKISDIEAKYLPRFNAYKELATTILASDGTNQAERIVALQVEYNALSDQKDLEIIEAMGGI
jgi:hypothetical protein